MKKTIRPVTLLAMLMLINMTNVNGQNRKNKTTQIPSPVAGMNRMDGFFPLYHDPETDKILLEVDKLNQEFIYINSLAAGVGSNDIGLDRGQIGSARIVKFQKFGQKIMLIQPNYDYRAISENEDEMNAVEEAFAQSVIWGFTIKAKINDNPLIEMTDFLLRDAHGVTDRLKARRQGDYTLDKTRSAVYMENTLNFPLNTEMEALLTFTGDPEGGLIRSVTPSANSVTVKQHHSFVQLPDDGYQPREFDPRSGYFGMSYMDYATPISEDITKRYITRHRLKKKNPTAVNSEAVEPITYYLDRGAPEPIRSALLEGAQWWNQAFEAIGYQDAFQVKLLPEGAHPMDVRYNVIQWVHRSTRGWSYGRSVTDPRTGEIIKGHVTLGSLRVRQDFLIAEGLLAPYEDGEAVPPHMQEMALARLRQLSAHEVGHTLGLAHNFAASVNNRASVMDYPHPYVSVKDGKIELSEAYDTGIGEWDKVTIAYGYSDLTADKNPTSTLKGILTNAYSDGLRYISDQDARPRGGAHPLAHLWDNGVDAADELQRVLQVRTVALNQFSEKNIRNNEPMTTLEDVLVPIYLLHRYQIEATVKLIGGMEYYYSVRGDRQNLNRIVPKEKQQQALDALMATIDADALALPENIISLIPPRAIRYERGREHFKIRTGLTFDPLGAAETAANMTVSLLLEPQRVSRLVEFKARDPEQLGLSDMINQLLDKTWKGVKQQGFQGEVQRVVAIVVLNQLMKLASDEDAQTQAKAIAYRELDQLKVWLENQVRRTVDVSQKAHLNYAVNRINAFQRNPNWNEIMDPLDPPDGSPIGFYELGCGFSESSQMN